MKISFNDSAFISISSASEETEEPRRKSSVPPARYAEFSISCLSFVASMAVLGLWITISSPFYASISPDIAPSTILSRKYESILLVVFLLHSGIA